MDGYVTIGTEIDTKSFDKQIEEVEYQLKQLDYELSHKKELKLDDRTIQEYELKAEKLTNQLVALKQKQEDLNKTSLSGISSQLTGVGNGIESVIKKVTRWGLAIFGIRSMYMLVRQSMSTLTQYNEQLATDVEYIRFALASALQPVIERIIQLAYTLLQYVNYLAQAWFGVNLFANATTEAFQKQNKAMGGTVKQAKELQKTLAGFDEMNILQENGDVTSGGGGGGVSLPTDDLSKKLNEIKIPQWLEWLGKNGKTILKVVEGIAIALGAIKFAQLLVGASKLTGALGVLAQLGVIAIGVELLYTALTGRELISDIMEIKKGLNDLNEIRNQEQKMAKKSQESTQSLIDTYNEVARTTGVTKEQTNQYIDTLINGIKTDEKLIENMEKQKSWLGALTGENEKITKTQQKYNETIDIQLAELKKLYDEGELNNKQKAIYISLLDKQTTRLATENTGIDKNSQKFKDNTEKIKNNKAELERITGKTYEVKTSIQTPNTSAFETKLRNLFNKISNWFGNISIGFGWGSGGGGFRAKGGIYYPSKLPRLAAGGIINQPGRGIPYHGATIGERGAEAVVPLTDSQQMALLGEAIGKYITINANITNTMNGRVISREIQKVQNQSNFAMNR